MILVSSAGLAELARACGAGYPEEACGVLLGRTRGNGHRAVERVVALENERTDERARRYLIGPDEFRNAEFQATTAGLDIVGFYHSHPDHPPVPSAFDIEHAWPWYAYVIVPVANGTPGEPRAWRLADDRSRFDEIPIVHEHAAAAAPTEEPR